MAHPLPKEDLEHVLAHTRPLWETFRGGKIFVTGATGFFGIWLLESFAFANKNLNLGASLVGLSRDPDDFYAKVPHMAQESSIALHRGDVRDFDFPRGSFTHVIHAGTTFSAPVLPSEMLDTIIRGTKRTLEFAVTAGAKRFLFVSSGAVYGKQPSKMTHIPETYLGSPDPMDPNSVYGEGKRVGELLCAIAHQETGLEVTIARCFAFVGPHLSLDAHFAVGNFMRDALRGGPILIKDGSPCRSYLYAADLAIWLWTILFRGGTHGAYNVGSEKEVSILELASLVARIVGANLTVKISQPLIGATKSSRCVPNCQRARRDLNLRENVALPDAINKTVRWLDWPR